MKKKAYIHPVVQCIQIRPVGQLASSTEKIPFDPNDDTIESLVKEKKRNNLWENDWHDE